ncbi:DUF2185 domain-containing protein [Myxococcus sp. K15C18031901]|uniref:immunity protein Imm33 domain-containing protein n=1 Tax=Myxococcus dinghuensis TaxID=2906761 RepID=UPI0020A7BA92|nr:DUF2185 domain-containing protein [Myxococcus dinghuensis]MCP3100265.1 DUF2185 domain-containing protein [Myxococcus dinghuensis]
MAGTNQDTVTVALGEVELPEGILVILDPGLGRFWRHDAAPASPRKKDSEQWDLRLVGRDAVAAGKAYDREFDARFLFDQARPSSEHFDAFARERGYDARTEVVTPRIPHTERARLALEHGSGLGVVKYNNLWAVAVGGLPSGRALSVRGVPMPPGEFAGRWRSIDIVVDAKVEPVRSESVEGVMVDHGQLLFAGLGPLGHFRMWEPEDGLADYVFWGKDAPALAKSLGAGEVADGVFGWKDLPMESVGEKATPLQERIEEENLAVGVDYRPHCNLEKLNALLRESPEDAATLVLAGAKVLGCGNRWGDGVFKVSRHFDAAGNVVLVRMELGTEERQRLMRRVQLRAKGAIVSRVIAGGAQPVRFAERLAPLDERDSGWAFSSGTEPDAAQNDPRTFTVVRLSQLVSRFPALDAILDAPVGARYRLEGERFIED